MSETRTRFWINDHPELLTRSLESNSIDSVCIELPVVKIEEVEALLTCPAMDKTIEASLRNSWGWKTCRGFKNNGCDVRVMFEPLISRGLRFDNTCENSG